MQEKNHVNALVPGMWYRCTRARISGGHLICVLDSECRYLLMDAYTNAPHVEFLNVKTGDDLTSFVRTFGPLDKRTDLPVDFYWTFQEWLQGWVGLVDAFKRSKDEPDRLREALHHYLDADRRKYAAWGIPGSDLSDSMFLSERYSLPPEPGQWIAQAGLDKIREATTFCLSSSDLIRVGLQATWRGRQPEINPTFILDNLRQALTWMVWQDESRKRPIGVCVECGTYFGAETAHERRYCRYECAHRAAAREWRRNDLRRKKETKARREKRS